ncbi:amidohydrolase family protein [Tundrisphaera sp. TA3]|uniref:amidohydrolase family protein n=1 Tax=Tundrisphaera sp. TA3 TaxID=3435775 RepID=UPI003EBE9896
MAWVLVGLMVGAAAAEEAAPGVVVLRGGWIVDGTGKDRYRGDVAIRGDRIIAVGAYQPRPGDRIVDASKWVVAPGFIDLHSHSDGPIVRPETRSNRNFQAQGVTTVVTGNCGGGALDVAEYFRAIDEAGAGTNVIHLIPHGAARRKVMGNVDREPDAAELDRMRALVDRGMADGAWGMSTGLIYLPGRYSKTAELVELSRVVQKRGGLYASHVRDEGSGLLRSIDEILTINREAGIPVHVSHLKASGKRNWGLTDAACARIMEARKDGRVISADQYPYIASSTQLAAMVVPPWARQGNAAEFARIADDPVQGPKLRREIQRDLDARDGGGSVRIARYAKKPSRVGKDLNQIAKEEGSTPIDVVIDIERNGGAQAISFGMSEADVRSVMAHDFVATASDGSAHRPGGTDKPHPRSYGTFPRKIRYALDDKVITLEQAIRSCSGLPATILGLPDRGILKPGAYADVVAFDPDTFRDAATFDDSTRYAPGVKFLFVNGVAAIADGEPRPALPGRALRLKKDGPADLILKVGRIWTGNPDQPEAEALAARGGEIVAVGSMADVEPFRGPSTRVVESPDGFATPGLVDAHAHLIELGANQEEIDLRGAESADEVARRVKARLDATPGDGWIIGANWDQSLWPGGAFPTAAVLDAVAPGRPVWLRRVDGHCGWANAEAMRRAKVTAASQAPPDGQIIRDDKNEPTGIFVDGAMGLVASAIPRGTDADLARRILVGQEIVLKNGLTGIHDASVSPRADAAAFRALDRAGKLKIRVYGMANPPTGREVEFVRQPPAPDEPNARFRLRAIKLFADGAMGSRGALLFEPYADDPRNKGLALIEPKLLEEIATEALRHGWQVCTHAIGDKGNAMVLDAYEAARRAVPEARDPRPRIEHAQDVRFADVARFKATGTTASMQPSHCSDEIRWAEVRLGPERAKGAYAWKWFADAGVPLAFGSDFPVALVDPLYGIYAAVTRREPGGNPPGGWNPEQRLTIDQALAAFTSGAARAAFAEDRLGTIKVGYRADVSVFDRDLARIDPAEIRNAKARMTIVEGEVLYEASRP